MALVLSETDYKRLTLFAKVAGIFTFSAGTVLMMDQGRILLGLALVALGTLITLAPVPMTVVKPADVAAADGDMLVVDE